MKVSVIIPCHNVEALLPTALRSVLDQDHPDLEVIAVDDGSTDGTVDILEQHAAQFPDRIRVITQTNQGASAARNAGMQAASGEWLQFLDADDVLLTDKISGQIPFTTDADVVIGDYEQIMPNGLVQQVYALYDRPWMALIKTRMGTTSANLWRRSAVEKAGGWRTDQHSSQDYELLFRMLSGGARIAWDHRLRTQVLKRAEGSSSRTDVQQNWWRYVKLRRAMKEHPHAADPKGFAAEIDALDQYIFMALRILATYDLEAAVHEHKRTISKGFVPEVGKAITERYVLLYKLLGFSGAERALRLKKGSSSPQP